MTIELVLYLSVKVSLRISFFTHVEIPSKKTSFFEKIIKGTQYFFSRCITFFTKKFRFKYLEWRMQISPKYSDLLKGSLQKLCWGGGPGGRVNPKQIRY